MLDSLFGSREKFVLKQTRTITQSEFDCISSLVYRAFKDVSVVSLATEELAQEFCQKNYNNLLCQPVSYTAFAGSTPVGFIHAKRLHDSNFNYFSSAVDLVTEWRQVKARSFVKDIPMPWAALHFRLGDKENELLKPEFGPDTDGVLRSIIERPGNDALRDVLYHLLHSFNKNCVQNSEYHFQIPSQRLAMEYVTSHDYMKMVTVVDPQFQNQGIAKLLNDTLERELRNKKVPSLFTYAIEEHGMYFLNLKRGFDHILSVRPFYENGMGAALMGKRL